VENRNWILTGESELLLLQCDPSTTKEKEEEEKSSSCKT
jgi:hypothetical protein